MLAHPQHHVVLAVDSLGKGALAQVLRAVSPSALHVLTLCAAEELLAAVAAAAGQPVCIPIARMTAVRLLGLPLRLFTTDPTATRLSALPRHRVRPVWLAPAGRWYLGLQAGALMPVAAAGHSARCGRAQPAAPDARHPAIR